MQTICQSEKLLSLGILIKECEELERNDLYNVFLEIIKEDNSYIQSLPYSFNDFLNYFFSSQSRVIICKKNDEVIAGFYIKPNFQGKGAHIANCGYIVKKSYRGIGLGETLGQTSLKIAKDLGYSSIMFNMVFKENIPAVNLWKKLGFSIIGTIPNAIKTNNGTYQDGLIMFQALY